MFKVGDRVRYQGAFGEGEGTVVQIGAGHCWVGAENGERAWLNASCLTLVQPPLMWGDFVRHDDGTVGMFVREFEPGWVSVLWCRHTRTEARASMLTRITQAEAQEAV